VQPDAAVVVPRTSNWPAGTFTDIAPPSVNVKLERVKLARTADPVLLKIETTGNVVQPAGGVFAKD